MHLVLEVTSPFLSGKFISRYTSYFGFYIQRIASKLNKAYIAAYYSKLPFSTPVLSFTSLFFFILVPRVTPSDQNLPNPTDHLIGDQPT